MQAPAIEGYELSPQQRRLWALQQAAGEGAIGLRCEVAITGPVDGERLRRALARLVARHEILRTTFVPAPGLRLPLQVVGDVPVFSFSDAPRSPASSVAAFDLAAGPTLHTAITARTPSEHNAGHSVAGQTGHDPTPGAPTTDVHVLTLTLPAICADPPSASILIRDLAAGYAAERPGVTHPVAPEVPPPQYADLAEWFNGLLRDPESEGGRQRWQGRHVGFDPAEAPFAHGGGPSPSFAPAETVVAFDGDMTERLPALADRLEVSPAALLLAAWQVLLRRLTGTAAVVGVLTDGRGHAELRDAVGPLARYVPASGDHEDEEPFAEVARRAEAALAEAATWGAYFAWEGTQAAPDTGSLPCFPCVFEYAERLASVRAGDVSFRLVWLAGNTDRFVLRLRCEWDGHALTARLGHDPSLIDRADAERLAACYATLQTAIAADPQAATGALDLIPGIEAERALALAAGPLIDLPEHATLPSLIAAQATRTPNATAVVGGDDTLTYGELLARADHLAGRLRCLGVGPESRVAVCFDRSAGMVVAVLGVLRAGGAYVPLDPTYPHNRLAFMLADAGVAAVVTRSVLVARLGEPSIPVILLDGENDEERRGQDDLPRAEAGPGNAAYVIYTSGTTGRPKGVIVDHRSVVGLLWALDHVIYREMPDRPLRATLNAPLSFDASVQQLVLLARGHALHVIGQEVRADAEALVRYIRQYRLDVLDCTPSHLRLMLAAGLLDPDEHVPGTILVAGEAVDDALWRTLASDARISAFNIYGPTECTVDATACRIAGEQPSIGRPLPNYEAYVIDARLRPVMLGAPGDLYLGGTGVARGYLDRPALTAERFVPHPFSSTPGARLYRTGDRARWLPDGTLEFLGRDDDQVKIRGNRVEVGEVEALLAGHPAVRQATVVAREEAPGDVRLVAYLVAPRRPAVSELRAWLLERAPEYMLPRAVVFLDALPLLASGKVDRRALPPPEGERPALDTAYAPPQTELEREIAAVWGQMLGIRTVGVHDNFFDLGGHSLLIVQVHGLLRQRLGQEFPLVSLFKHPTVAALAGFLSGEHDDGEARGRDGRGRAALRRDLLGQQRRRGATRQAKGRRT